MPGPEASDRRVLAMRPMLAAARHVDTHAGPFLEAYPLDISRIDTSWARPWMAPFAAATSWPSTKR